MIMRQVEAIVEREFGREFGNPAFFKVPGQAMSASGSFTHQGVRETAYISWGIAPGSGWPTRYNPAELVWLVNRQPLTINDNPTLATYSFALSATFPTSFPHPRIDAYIVIESARGIEVYKWWDDQYSFAPSIYQDLTATFT